jgi:glutathione S-transferase
MQVNSARPQPKLIVHGLDLSYFTGKLEAYLRAKGIPYDLREMTTASFRACGHATGMLQMPQVELPDGAWLTDTTLTIRHLEAMHPEPALLPADPVARFVALLIEDFGDEALWRPALHYRWSFSDDANLMSARLARGMLRDVPLPLFLRRQIIKRRQQHVYLRRDGITSETRGAVERLYMSTLEAMEQALAPHPFVMGDRPTIADIGLFGSMYRHFFSDPTPAGIMRQCAPRTLCWVTRLWAITPGDYMAAPPVETVPEKLSGLLRLVTTVHLPELRAHAEACVQGRPTASFLACGAQFEVPVSPYRAWCLSVIQRSWQALSAAERSAVTVLLADKDAVATLAALPPPDAFVPPQLPVNRPTTTRTRDRNGLLSVM